jgi:hypothetical protein
MNLIESRLLGISIDDAGREASFSFINANGAKCCLQLRGVERLFVTDFRQQNVIEGLTHWTLGVPSTELREAAFFLMTGVAEEGCDAALATLAQNVVERVARGELQLLEMTAIFGAQILASFSSMSLQCEP